MRACITALALSIIVSPSSCMSPQLAAVQNLKTDVGDPSKRVDCGGAIKFSVTEVLKGEVRYVEIKEGVNILGTIRVFTGAEVNGCALDEAKKTKSGFEISVEYGSRYYYHKRFIFICKRQKFYLNKV